MTIRPDGTLINYWSDIWAYRELLLFLAWRDILVRYKQTAIGIAWSVLRPLVTMSILTLVFGRLAKLPDNGVPYPVLVFTATLPWQFFSSALIQSSNSVIENAPMISKVFFPRIIIPVSATMVCFVDLLISALLLAGLMAWYGVAPGLNILALPLYMALAIIVALGLGFWFSALNVAYRDFRYVVPFLVQIGLYISPVGFSSSIVPDRYRLLYSFNPMVGVIDGFRWSILGTANLHWPGFGCSCLLGLLIFITGYQRFRKAENAFADII